MRSTNRTSVIYAIEEPETSQHTDNQKILVDAFKTLSNAQNTQVILTTHSANIVKALNYSNLRMITSQQNRRIVTPISQNILVYPSLNEVNYTAFDETTEEYHDELYSFLEINNWLNDYKNGKSQLPYVHLRPNGTTKNEQHILTVYIRHQVHHPENTLNRKYTFEELKQSIEDMRAYILAKREEV